MSTKIKLAYSVAEAVEATGLKRSFISAACGSGRLRARKTSTDADGNPVGNWVILAADLDRFLHELPEG